MLRYPAASSSSGMCMFCLAMQIVSTSIHITINFLSQTHTCRTAEGKPGCGALTAHMVAMPRAVRRRGDQAG